MDILMAADSPIRLKCFTPDSDPIAYLGHLRLNYEVFVAEQRWPLESLPSSRLTVAVPSDRHAYFVQASANGEVVGTVRGSMLHESFPHQEILRHHLEPGGLPLERDELATLNAIAVRAGFRGQRLPIAGYPQPLTIAKAMVCELVDWSRELGAVAVIFTAILGVSSVFFEHLGAYVIDPKFQMHDGKATEVVNMAIMTVDPERFDERHSPLSIRCPRRPLNDLQRACIDYCRTRHRAILGGRTIEQLAFESDSPRSFTAEP